MDMFTSYGFVLIVSHQILQKVIQSVFSVDFSVCSKPSLHVVFDSYSMYKRYPKEGSGIVTKR